MIRGSEANDTVREAMDGFTQMYCHKIGAYSMFIQSINNFKNVQVIHDVSLCGIYAH